MMYIFFYYIICVSKSLLSDTEKHDNARPERADERAGHKHGENQQRNLKEKLSLHIRFWDYRTRLRICKFPTISRFSCGGYFKCDLLELEDSVRAVFKAIV